MRIKTAWIVLLSVLVLASCGIRAPSWPWSPGQKICSGAISEQNTGQQCTEDDVLRNLSIASEYCEKVQGHYEFNSLSNSDAQLGIATLGTLAGSVAAPIAKGTASKAWAGLSGSTNALQAALNQAFSSAVNVNTRVDIANAYNSGSDQVESAAASGTPDQKVEKILIMSAKCSMSSAAAQQAALKSVINASTPTSGSPSAGAHGT